jgi:phospholipid/cholesterol/gamma-HCH transport system substrate-binding protein
MSVDSSRRLSLIVGTFVMLSLLLLAVILLTFSSEQGLFRPRYRLTAYFENVQGLTAGAPVRLAGRDVGTVEDVSFAPLDGNLPPIRVELDIDRGVQERIRSDSRASIGTIGLLGDKYVEISMGTPLGRALTNAAELPTQNPLDLTQAAERGTQAIDNIARLAENVNEAVLQFQGDMGTARIADSLASIHAIIEEVRSGEGLLHSLIYDSYEGSGVESIERSLATFEGILREIADGDGLLHSLIYDSKEDQEFLSEATIAGRRLNRILEKIDTGTGSLGLLVNDPALYEDMRALLGGAQDSFVVRSLIKLSTDEDE